MSRTRQKNATAITPALICGIRGLDVQIRLPCPLIPSFCGIGGHGVTIKYPLGESNPSRNQRRTLRMFAGDSNTDGIRYLHAPKKNCGTTRLTGRNPNNPGRLSCCNSFCAGDAKCFFD